MENFDFISFVKNGDALGGINFGTARNNFLFLKGKPTEIIGDSKVGYIYYYEGLKYGCSISGVINEMAIDFSKTIVVCKDVKSLQHGVEITEDFRFSSKTKLHDFIRFLNFIKLKWEVGRGDNLDYVSIKMNSGVHAVFHLHNGDLISLSKAIEI
jgi:hypothetical protein